MALMAHSSAGWEIRPHSRNDRAAIERVFLDCHTELPWRTEPGPDLNTLRYALKYSSVLVAHEKDAGGIGFIVFLTERCYVSHLFVDMNWRFCGVARGLLDVGRTLSSGPLQVDLDTQNTGALAAYAAMGWTETVSGGPNLGIQWRLTGP